MGAAKMQFTPVPQFSQKQNYLRGKASTKFNKEIHVFLLSPGYPLVSCAACRGLLRLGKGPNAHPLGSEASISPRTASLAPAAASLSQKMANGGSTKIRFPLGFARI
uniref:Uncharacterized protein n=1 Tax=Candidozyma auris TaxID=498019 RepID=A0A0L0NXA9_CANAR